MTSRPLSPHVGIYRWQISNTLSILHRLSGIALSIGATAMVLWLWAAAYDGVLFRCIRDFFGGPFGTAMLVGWSAAFYYHLGNGIRHLFWDIGRGYSLPTMTKSGWLVLVFAASATGLTWWCILQQLAEK